MAKAQRESAIGFKKPQEQAAAYFPALMNKTNENVFCDSPLVGAGFRFANTFQFIRIQDMVQSRDTFSVHFK